MFSPSAILLASYITDSLGYLPIDVSDNKINASAPSSTEAVMSSASDLKATGSWQFYIGIIDSKT